MSELSGQFTEDAFLGGKLRLRQLKSGHRAGHDAMHLAKICPSGMIFVPCKDGVSHNEAESATPEHLAAGARVLAEALVALADG